MRNAIKESLFYGALYALGCLLGYGVAWLIDGGPAELKQKRKARRYIEMPFDRDEEF